MTLWAEMRTKHEILGKSVSPLSAFESLSKDPGALLVDVRTDAEWSFVGIPDLQGIHRRVILCSWKLFPGMQPNFRFAEELSAHLGQLGSSVTLLLFICRSGIRSREAMQFWIDSALSEGFRNVCNISEGFEGDVDAWGHRGMCGGWKYHGLPWRQN